MRPFGDIIVGDIVWEAVALCPDPGYPGDGETAKVGAALPLGKQHGGSVVVIRQGRKKRQVIVVAENGENRDARKEGVPGIRGNFAGITPVTNAEKAVRGFAIEQAKQRFRFAMQIPDSHNFTQVRAPA